MREFGRRLVEDDNSGDLIEGSAGELFSPDHL